MSWRVRRILLPVLIRQGRQIGEQPAPSGLCWSSPNQPAFWWPTTKRRSNFEEREVLIAAKHLTGLEGV